MPAMTETDRTPTAGRQDAGSHDRPSVTVAAAADRLGVTPDAVRGRLHRGTLSGEKVGTEWRVFLPHTGGATADRQALTAGQQPPTAGRQDTTGDRQGVDRPDALGLVALVADLARRNEELAAAAGMWQTRAAHLEVRLAQLTAGHEGDGDALDASPATPGGAETPEPGLGAPAPWWAFWRR
jgi:hypothetical protein